MSTSLALSINHNSAQIFNVVDDLFSLHLSQNELANATAAPINFIVPTPKPPCRYTHPRPSILGRSHATRSILKVRQPGVYIAKKSVRFLEEKEDLEEVRIIETIGDITVHLPPASHSNIPRSSQATNILKRPLTAIRDSVDCTSKKSVTFPEAKEDLEKVVIIERIGNRSVTNALIAKKACFAAQNKDKTKPASFRKRVDRWWEVYGDTSPYSICSSDKWVEFRRSTTSINPSPKSHPALSKSSQNNP